MIPDTEGEGGTGTNQLTRAISGAHGPTTTSKKKFILLSLQTPTEN
jgi:hypothetical protein